MRKCKNGGWVDADFAREMELENARLRDAHVAITEIVKQILRAWDDGANYRHMAPEIAALRKHCKPNAGAEGPGDKA